MLTATCMREIGKMTRRRGSAATRILMEPSIRVTGLTTNSMGRVERIGRTVPATLEVTNAEKSTDTESSCGRTSQSSKGISSRTKYMAKERTAGQTVGPTTETGLTIRCTEKVFSNGQTKESTKENTSKTKRKATGCLYGQTAGSMRADG